jgi:N-acetylneuraminic acid mutarotase
MWSLVDVSGDVPLGRSSTASALIDQKLYVFSGEHDPRNPVDGDMYELDLSSQSNNQSDRAQTSEWKRYVNDSSSWPAARVGHAAACHQGKFYMYGGRGNADSHDTMSDFWCFDSKQSSSQWAKLPLTGNPPPPLSYHTMTSDAHKVYVFGGCTSDGRSNQLWAFNVATQTWTQETTQSNDQSIDQPCPRGGASIVHASDGLHVLFGYNGKQEQVDHWLWHADTHNWEQLSTQSSNESSDVDSCPAARSVTDVVFLPNLGVAGALFVFGGEYTPSAEGHLGAGSYHNDAWLFDISSRQWGKVHAANAPSARGWFNTVALDGKSAVVFGGFDGKDRVNDVHVWRGL